MGCPPPPYLFASRALAGTVRTVSFPWRGVPAHQRRLQRLQHLRGRLLPAAGEKGGFALLDLVPAWADKVPPPPPQIRC